MMKRDVIRECRVVVFRIGSAIIHLEKKGSLSMGRIAISNFHENLHDLPVFLTREGVNKIYAMLKAKIPRL